MGAAGFAKAFDGDAMERGWERDNVLSGGASVAWRGSIRKVREKARQRSSDIVDSPARNRALGVRRNDARWVMEKR